MDHSTETLLIKDLDSGVYVDQHYLASLQTPPLTQNHWEVFWQQLYDSHKALCQAAQSNDQPTLRRLLSPHYQLPIDINMKLEESWCALHYACIEGNLESSQILLENGAKPDSLNIQKRSPLHVAAMKGFLSVCAVLLRFQATIDLQDFQSNTPLHLASQLGHADVVELLLDHQADYNIRNNFSKSPYDLAHEAGIGHIYEKRNLIDAYQRRSFTGISGRSDHISKLLSAHQPIVKAPSLTTKVLRVQIQEMGPRDFQVLQPLGKGSFGQVYLVKQKGSMNQYAMKILNKAKIIQANITRYIQTEKKILSMISCPFIVKLHYAFQTENKLYLILDYCPGGDLEQLMNERGPLPEKVAKTFSAEILLAIEVLHQNCIIYRDLKPSNVVIDREGHSCLTDFGLSKELTSNRTTSYCGSHAYLAPEMLDKSGHGFPLDWYLYGVFVYELVSGKPPYYERDRNQLYANIRYGQLSRPAKISDSLWDMLQRLLDRNPSRRLGSRHDAEEIKQHQWFSDIDFHKAQQRQLPVPRVSLKHIDEEGDLKITFSEFAQTEPCQNYIQDWSYTS